jgi:acyl-CoA reductase-like NAD-dependent aldehyde dehydrogenase
VTTPDFRNFVNGVEDEILLSVDRIRFFAGAARNLEGKSAGEYMTDHTSFVRRDPIGVVGQVTPWNYPLNVAVWKFAPALAAGNTTVLKPSDTTPTQGRTALPPRDCWCRREFTTNSWQR